MSLLKELNAKLDFKDNTLTVNDIIIPLEYESDEPEMTQSFQNYLNNITFKEDLFRLDHLNAEEKKGISQVLKKYSNIFFKEGDTLSLTNAIKHGIRT